MQTRSSCSELVWGFESIGLAIFLLLGVDCGTKWLLSRTGKGDERVVSRFADAKRFDMLERTTRKNLMFRHRWRKFRHFLQINEEVSQNLARQANKKQTDVLTMRGRRKRILETRQNSRAFVPMLWGYHGFGMVRETVQTNSLDNSIPLIRFRPRKRCRWARYVDTNRQWCESNIINGKIASDKTRCLSRLAAVLPITFSTNTTRYRHSSFRSLL